MDKSEKFGEKRANTSPFYNNDSDYNYSKGLKKEDLNTLQITQNCDQMSQHNDSELNKINSRIHTTEVSPIQFKYEDSQNEDLRKTSQIGSVIPVPTLKQDIQKQESSLPSPKQQSRQLLGHTRSNSLVEFNSQQQINRSPRLMKNIS